MRVERWTRIRSAVSCGEPVLPCVTFHRAFEEVADPVAGFSALSRWPQVDRVLVNGGAGVAVEIWHACEVLPRSHRQGSACWRRLAEIADLLGAALGLPDLREAHVGRAARDPETVDSPVAAAKVRELVSRRNAAQDWAGLE